MALFHVAAERGPGAPLARPVARACLALAFAYAVYLAASYAHGLWIVAPDGGGVPSDFVNVWAAGRMALAGHAAAAYDWPAHKLVEEAAVGHPFAGYFGWHYPPTFLFVAAALALIPYAAAYALWVFGTFPIYLATVGAVVGDRTGYLLAAAFPAVLANFVVGQNGFLTAGLIGGALACLPRRPLFAGVLVGLLAYKPHLGLLFPIALAAGGHWRTATSAALVALLAAAAAWLAFGGDAWAAFFANIGHTSRAFLSEGRADWSKLQTAFGLIRTVGGSEALAWAAQAATALSAAAAVALLWRTAAAPEIKAAALATGAMLATPYLYTYDLVVLAVPLAFLYRLGRARGFLPRETAGIGLACLLILSFPFVKAPVGFAALVIVAALIARRALVAPRIAA
jgi:arabinofuranan 3-O-arabinosyltransferase